MSLKTLKRTCFFLAFLITCQISFAQHIKHEVKAGETLYSLGKKYNVSVDAIKQANNLQSETIRAGQVIQIPGSGKAAPAAAPAAAPSKTVANTVPATKVVVPTAQPVRQEQVSAPTPAHKPIPKCKLTYITEKKTTITDVCAKFGVTRSALLACNPDLKKEKIKKRVDICIPYTEAEIAEIRRQEAEEARRQAEEAERRRLAELEKLKLPNINIALVLPFELAQQKKSQEAIKMIDFYEGLLLAVDDLTSNGAKISIDVYDESEKSIGDIINELRQKDVHLIIGAKDQENIQALRNYSKGKGITLAVPFSSREDITLGYPTLFQVNSKASALYDKVYQKFIEENKGSQVIFVNNTLTDDVRYINGFRDALSKAGIRHQSISADQLGGLPSIMAKDCNSVLIPTSKSVESFKAVTAGLDTLDTQLVSRVRLFGYPEWQTFSTENTNKIRKYHGSFYTTFYANLTSAEVHKFADRFKKKFKRDQYNSRPLYGLLGYDVTHFFVGGLHQFGLAFQQNQEKVKIQALQNPMQFERNMTSVNGFVNKNIKIIHL